MKKILIADDYDEIRWLIRLSLDALGCEMIEAKTGQQAHDLALLHSPDVLLLDVMMPGQMDGLQVCQALKVALPNLKVILLTARGQQADLEEGIQAGADAYLVKPFSPLELLELVKSFV